MTIHAQYWVHGPARRPAEHVVRLTTITAIAQFVTALFPDAVSDAILTHERRPRLETVIPDGAGFLSVPDHCLIAGVRGERATLSYRGFDGFAAEPVHLFSRGPFPAPGGDEFPPDREVPLSTLADALTEFLHTARRPLCVEWQPARSPVLS